MSEAQDTEGATIVSGQEKTGHSDEVIRAAKDVLDEQKRSLKEKILANYTYGSMLIGAALPGVSYSVLKIAGVDVEHLWGADIPSRSGLDLMLTYGSGASLAMATGLIVRAEKLKGKLENLKNKYGFSNKPQRKTTE